MSREGREDVVALVRGDPLLEPPDAGLGGDLADDARHAGVERQDKEGAAAAAMGEWGIFSHPAEKGRHAWTEEREFILLSWH